MDITHCHVPKKFNPNTFWNLITGNYQYGTGTLKEQLLKIPISEWPNVYLHVVAREDSLNVPHLSKLCFLYNMSEGNCIGPGSFFINQLHSVATSFANKIVIGALITPIARSIGVEHNLVLMIGIWL